MRTSSFQAWFVNATSRAASSVVSHSGAYSAQNWLHPAGARAASPTEMNNARSLAAWADAIDSIAAVEIGRASCRERGWSAGRAARARERRKQMGTTLHRRDRR